MLHFVELNDIMPLLVKQNNGAFDSFGCRKRLCVTFDKSNKKEVFKRNKPQINPKTVKLE